MAEVPLPSETDQLIAAASYQLRFYVRTWRFIGLAILIAAITAIFGGLTFDHGVAAVKATTPTVSDFLLGGLGGMASTVAIVCAFFGGDAIAMDFGSGGGYFSLVQPIRRPVLLLGRYIAAAIASTLVLLVYWGPVVIAGGVAYGTLPLGPTLGSLGLLVLSILAVLSFAFFFSALFSRPIVAIVVTVLLMVIAFPIVEAVLPIAGIEPLFVVNYATQVIGQVFLPQPHSMSTVIMGRGNGTSVTLTMFNPILWQATAVLFLYFVIFLAVAIVIHLRKEVKG